MLFLNILFPDVLIEFLMIFKFAALDILPNPFEIVLDLPDVRSPEKFYNNNLTGLFLQNSAPILCSFVLIFVIWGLARILSRKFKVIGKIAKSFDETFPIPFFNNISSNILMGSILQSLATNFSSSIEGFSVVFSFFYYPILLLYFLKIFKVIKRGRFMGIWKVLAGVDFDIRKPKTIFF